MAKNAKKLEKIYEILLTFCFIRAIMSMDFYFTCKA